MLQAVGLGEDSRVELASRASSSLKPERSPTVACSGRSIPTVRTPSLLRHGRPTNKGVEEVMDERNTGEGTHQRNAELVERFYALLEAMEMDEWLYLWAEDGVQEMPFAPRNFPGRLEGKEAVKRQYSGMPEAYSRMVFPGLTIRPMADPEWIMAEYRGEIDLIGGGSYNNRYCGVFHIRDGRIALFREYFDPIVLTESFGGEEALAQTFSLQDCENR